MHDGCARDTKADATTKYHVSEPKEPGNLALILVKRASRELLDGKEGSSAGPSRSAAPTGSPP